MRIAKRKRKRKENNYNPKENIYYLLGTTVSRSTPFRLVVQILPRSTDRLVEILRLDLLATREVAGRDLGVD